MRNEILMKFEIIELLLFEQHDDRREREQRENMMKKKKIGRRRVCLCLRVCLFVSKAELERTGRIPVFIDKTRKFNGLKWC